MLPTLIVEDDHLVRKGLIHTLPWSRYDMEIVGEAENGEEALELMRSREIGLLVTDLTMPVMSGFELIQEVIERYPQVWIVVLTCHQDFEFIQEALRMGAIDYVVKTQLSKDSFDAVLRRIHERIQRDAVRHKRLGGNPSGADSGILWVWDRDGEPDAERLLRSGPAFERVLQVGEKAWFALMPDGSSDYEASVDRMDTTGWRTVRIRQLNGAHPDAVVKWLTEYTRTHLFYEMDPSQPYVTAELSAIRAFKPKGDGHAELRNRFLQLRWLFQESEFTAAAARMEEERPSRAALRSWVGEIADAWAHMTDFGELHDLLGATEGLAYWCEWRDWLSRLRQLSAARQRASGYSEEIYLAVMQSLLRVKQDLKDVHQREIASAVNLSRGYFSGVFQDITGRPFNKYVRILRITEAKKLLKENRFKPIYWVAEQAGFHDEGYFSRVFREETGLLPSEFRTG